MRSSRRRTISPAISVNRRPRKATMMPANVLSVTPSTWEPIHIQATGNGPQ